MIATVHSQIAHGAQYNLIRIEVSVEPGLKFQLTGTRDPVMREAPARIRAAFQSVGWRWPGKRITVLLHPLDLPKYGADLDLPMALAIAMASGRIRKPQHQLWARGALDLSGQIWPLQGSGVASAHQIAGSQMPTLHPAQSLKDALKHVHIVPTHPRGHAKWPPVTWDALTLLTFEVAAAGAHPLLLYGPPGQGKTEFVKLYHLFLERVMAKAIPFREPPVTTTARHLVHQNGEWHRARGGILFLDEGGEMTMGALEALRKPLDALAEGKEDLRVILATNPCACGFLGHESKACACSPASLAKYERRLSRALFERFQLVHYLDQGQVMTPDWELLMHRWRTAQKAQMARGTWNAYASVATVQTKFALKDTTRRAIIEWKQHDQPSHRAIWHALRVARTLADLDSNKHVLPRHFAQAIALSARSDP